jgi:hypothetical protein
MKGKDELKLFSGFVFRMLVVIFICMRFSEKEGKSQQLRSQHVYHASTSALCHSTHNPSIKEIQISCFYIQR